jgi:hypothetical protein
LIKKRVVMAVVLAIAAHWHSQSLAQSSALISNNDLSKESENPVTRLIMLPLRYEGEFQDGVTKATKSTFEIDQAVVPFRLNDDWALIPRTKLPAEVLSPKNTGDHWVDGLSNGYTTFFLSPEHGRDFYWGVGPVLYYPTARTRRLESTNGAPARRQHFCSKTPARLSSAWWPTTSGPSAGHLAAVTERTSCCSIHS